MSDLLALCASLPTRSVAKGETVFDEGAKDGEILVLKSGRVEVRKGEHTVTTVEHPGSVFGEIALLLDQGHSAGVVALEDSEFHVAPDGDELLASNPEVYREIARVVAQRLVRASERVAELLERLDDEKDLSDFQMMMLWDE